MNAWITRLLMALVRGYRLLLSPSIGNACRFEPTCSAYALDALAKHGAVAGTALAVGRIARCHPWCAGGFDPAPEQLPQFLSSLLARPIDRAAFASPDVSDSASP